MDTELISKKELLEATGISYGQLYRWKRKKLIPEEWFIRKSTFTGQETYFPKGEILSRVSKIIAMKDELSLDELAGKLSPVLYDLHLPREEIVRRNIVTAVAMERLGAVAAAQPASADYSFEAMLYMYVADRLLQTGEMSLDEGEQLIRTLRSHFEKFEGRSSDLVFVRKLGVAFFMLIASASEFYSDEQAKIVARISLMESMEKLKLKLS
ncbi:YhbD family protein [Paenibacillus sp. GCM10027626]|uniref:YhbD family protein n=1 Tax=Paenibacillus sp. GCM10027626 TaxID=3273411 RepID=UPI003630829D